MQVPDRASYDFCHMNKNTSFEQVSHNLKKSTRVWFTLTSPGKYGTLPSTGLQLLTLSYKTSKLSVSLTIHQATTDILVLHRSKQYLKFTEALQYHPVMILTTFIILTG